jgi:hypothetical protein
LATRAWCRREGASGEKVGEAEMREGAMERRERERRRVGLKPTIVVGIG